MRVVANELEGPDIPLNRIPPAVPWKEAVDSPLVQLMVKEPLEGRATSTAATVRQQHCHRGKQHDDEFRCGPYPLAGDARSHRLLRFQMLQPRLR